MNKNFSERPSDSYVATVEILFGLDLSFKSQWGGGGGRDSLNPPLLVPGVGTKNLSLRGLTL